jgi:ATP-dependent helicase HrpA
VVLEATYREVFIADQPLPRNVAEFNTRLLLGRGRITETAHRYAELLQRVAEHYAALRSARRKGGELAWLPVLGEIDAQLALLFSRGFITDTPWQQLQHYPRYLKAIEMRLDKLRGHFARDRQLARELAPLQAQLEQALQKEPDGLRHNPELFRYRWQLEELRVSLFAQTLGTPEPVSAKRLREQWGRVETARRR